VAIGMWQHSIDLLWLIVFKEFQGGWGVQPPEAVRFCNLRALKYPKTDANKINNANLYHTSLLDYCNFQQGTMAHPGPH